MRHFVPIFLVQAKHNHTQSNEKKEDEATRQERRQLRNRSVAGSQILAVSACHEEVLGPRQSNDQREQRGLPSGTMGLRVDAPKLRGSKTGCYQSLSLNPMGYNPRENIFRTNTRRRISGSPPRVKYSPELVTESVKLLDQNCDNTSRFEHRDKCGGRAD